MPATFDALGKGRVGHSRAIVNSHESITADFIRDPNYRFPGQTLRAAIEAAVAELLPKLKAIHSCARRSIISSKAWKVR